MQVGLLNGQARSAAVQRINFLTAIVRKQSGKVIWVRHCGKAGDGFERYTEGWSLLPELSPHRDDVVIEKTLNDPFVRTSLQETLERIAPDRLLVAGGATDSCVDSTIRSAISNDYHVVVVSDGHTVSDRPHLDAATVIRHHHLVWSDLITNRSVRITTTRRADWGGWCHPAQQHVDARNAARGHVIVLIAGERGFEEVQNAARAVLVIMVPTRSRKSP